MLGGMSWELQTASYYKSLNEGVRSGAWRAPYHSAEDIFATSVDFLTEIEKLQLSASGSETATILSNAGKIFRTGRRAIFNDLLPTPMPKSPPDIEANIDIPASCILPIGYRLKT